MHTLTRLLLLSSVLGLQLACAAKPTSVAINPISGSVYWTTGDTLWSCDSAGENCTQGKVMIEPKDTAITADSRLVFVTSNSVYVCNDEGQACIEVKLPSAITAAGLSVSPSGEIFVVGSDGELVRCNETSCRAVPDKPAAKTESAAHGREPSDADESSPAPAAGE